MWIIDNTSPKFSSTMVWAASNALRNFYGTNFLSSGTSGNDPVHIPEIVIDNNVISNSYGKITRYISWPVDTAISGYYGSNYAYLLPSTTGYSKILSYTFKLRSFGNLGNAAPMTVLAHWPAHAGNATNAEIRIKSAGGQTMATYVVNQQQSTGTWLTLGNVTLYPSQTYYLEYDATGVSGRVVADAVRIISNDAATAKTAKWRQPSGSGLYEAYVRTPASPSGNEYGSWSAIGANGSDSLVFPSQRTDGGAWRKVGNVSLNGTQENYVLLEHFGSYYTPALFADAVMTVPYGQFPFAQWTANVTGAISVYASWSADATRTSAARYKVFTSGAGCTGTVATVVVDQRNSYSAPGLLLGAFSHQSGCGPLMVQLTNDVADTTMSADAVTVVK